ncbi:MAG: LysR family transcriptional regulator [Beijerinckiaceae bacterium]
MQPLDWNLARAFRATAEAGSLSAAARQLGLTQPTLSRQIVALEASLGVALFDRIGKRLVLTESGAGLLEHAAAMALAADSFALAAAGRAQEVEGRVSISATDAMSAWILPEIVARIREEAPQITVLIVASNALSDLRRREADIAIRHVRPEEPELIARRLGDMTARFYAAESWIARHGRPTSKADLAHIDVLGFEPIDRFAAHLQREGAPVTAAQFRIVSESAVVLWEMLRMGLGVGMMLDEIGATMPGVMPLFPGEAGVSVPLWLVTHQELRTSRRVRIVYEIIARELAGDAQRKGE